MQGRVGPSDGRHRPKGLAVTSLQDSFLARHGGWRVGVAGWALALAAGGAGAQQPAPPQDCLCITNAQQRALGFQVQFSGRSPMAERVLEPNQRAWYCLQGVDPAQPPVPAFVMLAQDPAQPQQRTRYGAPTLRVTERSCDAIGPRAQFIINPEPDGQRVMLQVREVSPPPEQQDAEAWQRHRTRLTADGIRSATHGHEAAGVCRHLLAERARDVAALRQRQPATATPVQVERTRLFALTQTLAALELACKDQPEYRLRDLLLTRLERSLLACQALGGSEADCEPGAAW